MDLSHPQCAGLDIHQRTVVACARVVADSAVTHDRRTFGTTTADLEALRDWLTAHGCTHVAMESTGVDWTPIWEILEGRFALVLANARHVRAIPGRKSDVNDATPGVSETVARVLVAEIGFDMTRVATAGHLVSWAGLCPRLDESAGKRLSTRTRPSNPWLKTTLVQAAWAASRKKDGYLRAQFLHLKSRRGPKKAILAVAASMLTAAYHMLKHDVDYRDLGADHFDRRDKAKLAPPPDPAP
jgi:transposase